MTERANWFTNARLGWISFACAAIGVFYSVVIQNNNLQNESRQNREEIIKMNGVVIGLQDKKLDKETFNLILMTLTDLKTDVRGLQISLNEHMNKK